MILCHALPPSTELVPFSPQPLSHGAGDQITICSHLCVFAWDGCWARNGPTLLFPTSHSSIPNSGCHSSLWVTSSVLSNSDPTGMVCWPLSPWPVVSFSFDQIKFIFVSLAESTARYIYVLSCLLKEWINKWRSLLGMEAVWRAG